MQRNTTEHLQKFNKIYKEMDIIYHTYAKSCGLSDMAYWILYSMSESDKLFTQRDFCKEWFSPPQTVNSALKDLEKRDIIFLEPVPGNKKNKWIKLTENGKKFMARTVSPLIRAECESFEELSSNECTAMLCATHKYMTALKNKTEQLINNASIQETEV